MLISIIIPAYNAEYSIKRCVNSVLEQTYSEIELIIVNDGSTDNTLKVLSNIVDSKIKIYTTNNQGALAARLYGVQRANGEYLMFVDSDDWIEKNMVEKLFDSSRGGTIDFIMCGLQKDKSNLSTSYELIPKEIFGNKEIRKNLVNYFLEESINGPCCKLIKKSLFTNLDLFIDNRIVLQEDLLLNIKLLEKIESFVAISNCLYHYVINENSITHKYIRDKFMMTSEVYKTIENFFVQFIDNICINELYWLIIKNYYAAIIDLHLPGSDLSNKEKYNLIKKYRKVEILNIRVKIVDIKKYSGLKKLLIFLLKLNNSSILFLMSYIMYLIKFRFKTLYIGR